MFPIQNMDHCISHHIYVCLFAFFDIVFFIEKKKIQFNSSVMQLKMFWTSFLQTVAQKNKHAMIINNKKKKNELIRIQDKIKINESFSSFSVVVVVFFGEKNQIQPVAYFQRFS